MNKEVLKYSTIHALLGGLVSFYLGSLGLYIVQIINLDSKFGLEPGISKIILGAVAFIIFIIGVHISSSILSKKVLLNKKDIVGLSSIFLVFILLIVNFIGNGDYITVGLYLVIFFIISRSNLK